MSCESFAGETFLVHRNSRRTLVKMPRTLAVAALLGLFSGLAQPASALTSRANSTCTFTGADGYLKLSQTKNDCSTIVLDSLQVPGNVTLDLEDLNDGTTVRSH